ncbi:MAG: DUF6093 family protein [Coriobacteriia bacterium]
MSVADGATLMGRRQAEALMTSTCEITRVTGRTLSESTGQYTDVTAVVYSGKCELRFDSAKLNEVDGQGQILVEQSPVVKLPVDGSADVKVGDVGTLTGHPLDSGLVGLTFRVAGLHSKTRATARRLPVEVLS